MSLVESYVRHPSYGSNAEPKVSAAAQCATKGNGVALSQPRGAFGCRRDTCSDAKESPFPTFFKGKVRTTISLNTMRMNSCPLGMDRGLAINCFFYRQRRTFFTAKGRFLNRGGCCRHAKHGVGDGGDDKKENLFSDWRHRQPQKGEADNSRHGFLYLPHPLIEAADNGLVQRQSLCFLLWVTPSAKHNIHCDAPPY